MEESTMEEKKSTEKNRPNAIMKSLIGLKITSKICRRD
jgi:hypothetical protein